MQMEGSSYKSKQLHAFCLSSTFTNVDSLIFFYRYVVHSDICTVHSPTNALFILNNTLKFTLKYT